MSLVHSWRLRVAALGLTGGLIACGSQATVTAQPTDSGTTDDATTPLASPPPCGTLDSSSAGQAVVSAIDSVLIPSIHAFAMVDTSTILARALTIGASPSVSPVASTTSVVQSIRDTLANRWLVASNVESTDAGVVTFLVPPSVLCEGPGDAGAANGTSTSGGPGGSDAGPGTNDGGDAGDCAAKLAAYPLRVRVYRVACDAGNGVEMDWLVGTDQELLLGVEFDSARVYGRLFFAPLSSDGLPLTTSSTATVFALDGGVESNSTTISAAITKLDPGATGVLTATLETTDTQQTRAVLAVPQGIALGITPDGGPRTAFAVGASTIVDVTVGGGAMSGTLGLGDTSITSTLSGFVQSEFGRNLVDGADPNEPVVVETSGFDGQFTYTAVGDALTATGLGLGDAGAHAWYDGGDLVRVAVAPDAGAAVSFQATPGDAGGVNLTFEPNFGLAIRYTMAPVASEVVDLQAFASDDLFSITLTGSGEPSVTLFEDPNGSSPSALDLVGSQQGPLLELGAGNLALTSTFAPDASVYVTTPQCLVRTPGQPGVHDILKDLSAGSCP